MALDLDHSRVVNHSGPHLWTQLIPQFMLALYRPNLWSHYPDWFYTVIANASLQRRFLCFFRFNEMSRIRANNGNKTRKFCAQREITIRDPGQMNLANDGYRWLQLFCCMLGASIPLMGHTTRHAEPLVVSWPGTLEMVASSDIVISIGEWGRLYLSTVVTKFTDWLRALVHGSQVQIWWPANPTVQWFPRLRFWGNILGIHLSSPLPQWTY